MDSLTMNIEQRWFRAIVDREKKIEYQTMSPFWMPRIEPLKTPFLLRLLNGMLPPVPEAVVEVMRVVRDDARQEYQLHLGKVLRVKNWDRKAGKPSG
jgi:hypothetical protein